MNFWKAGVAALAFVLFCAFAPATPERTVVVVLFDGFAPAEVDAAKPMPNFDRLKRVVAAFGAGVSNDLLDQSHDVRDRLLA